MPEMTVDELIEALQRHRGKPLRLLVGGGLMTGVKGLRVIGERVVVEPIPADPSLQFK